MNSKSMTAREKVFNEAANNLKRFTEINNPENIASINKKQVAKVTVTVDGTWQNVDIIPKLLLFLFCQ